MRQTCECYNMLPCEELSWECQLASAFDHCLSYLSLANQSCRTLLRVSISGLELQED